VSRATEHSTSLKLATTAFVVLWLIIAAFPYVWTAWGSLKVEGDFFSRESWWNAVFGFRTLAATGSAFTFDAYYGAWVESEFWKAVINTVIVATSVTVISLTFGTLGGYALSRSGHRYKYWILIAALVARAMPHITLVSGYLLPFFQLNIWGYLPTTIIVLVALNQPFTLWMLYSFFVNVPRELDESALVDGCSRFKAFALAVLPVAWPGIVTTGLFSFLLGYNDFTVTSMLLNQENQTMIPKISGFLFKIQSEGHVMYAVAAVVSATVPVFLLVTFFQRQLVAGLTEGAVKG
jgi:ABC-type glycerol-3-phosphate transport system permease component